MGLTQGTQNEVSSYFQTGLERRSDFSQQLGQVVVVVVGVGVVVVVVVMASCIKGLLPSSLTVYT